MPKVLVTTTIEALTAAIDKELEAKKTELQSAVTESQAEMQRKASVAKEELGRIYLVPRK